MKPFQLEILTPERVFYRGECLSVIVPITDGMFGIMAGCEPVTASVVGGEASYTNLNGEKIIFSVSIGMVDVENNKVKILCEYALLPEEIDEKKELQVADEARLEMIRAQSKRDYMLSKIQLKNAVNNLKVKQRNVNN